MNSPKKSTSFNFNTFWFFIIFITISLVISFIVGGFFLTPKDKSPKPPVVQPTPTNQKPTPIKEQISNEEKQRIDAWIEKNNLNQYGDQKDTVYTGGTPLFNEVTGQTIDRYDYILQNHPDRPWNK